MIKICFLHPYVHDLESMISFCKLEMGGGEKCIHDNFIWNTTNPDILIGSEWIYYSPYLWNAFVYLYNKSDIKIEYSGEAHEPDFNIFDYCIGYSDQYENLDRYIRKECPFTQWPEFIKCRQNNHVLELDKKKNFCNFIYSNGNAHPMRDTLFSELTKYKMVNSLGKHLRNSYMPNIENIGNSVDIKSNFKFSIACENAEFDGYTSEKIVTSLNAHTIPIYWGNKNISADFNPECFINVRDFENFDQLREKIKEIDENEELFESILNKEWQTAEQVQQMKDRDIRYFSFFEKMNNGELKKKVPEGFHISLYRDRLFNGNWFAG
jgi:alpha(1,3/1,4) fucosyltransferase